MPSFAQPTALLIVDVQTGVLAEAWQGPAVVERIGQALAQARAAGLPVLWVQHQSEELVPGSPAWQWAPPLAPAPGEPVLAKRFNSSFEDTALQQELAQRGIRHLLLAGAQSNWCIRATAHGALERGYALTLLRDAHTTGDLEPAPGLRIPAEHIVAELNTAMRWMDYPGRTCAARSVAEVFGG